MHNNNITKKPYLLLKNVVHVWYAYFSNNTNNLNYYLKLLSEDEIKKTSKFKFKTNQQQSIISRGILRQLSSKYLNIKPESLSFKYGKYGKPEYDFDSKLKFNISHSGGLIVLGFVKDFDIGVDVEKVKNDFDVLEIASNFFSALEIEALKKVPKEKQVENFYRCWTRKESFVKAKSLGLSFALDSFSVCINSNSKSKLLETKWNEAEKHKWQLHPFTLQPDYKGAISILGNIKTVKYFNFNNYNFNS
ncbi:4'-phosphopantetheinyl transferase family protein [Gelatiniphilus marinus]|uniref:4'-phosphopantetheinyl transferase family protein n=1 Tax=Gelatiniphilus marinus TaxID=1759464 RepID=A0ABW5JRS2_9FLAO